MRRDRKILAVIEARTLTGPAKNLLGFAQRAAAGTAGFEPLEIRLITYKRPGDPAETPFIQEARRRGLTVDAIRERGPFDFNAALALRRLIREHSPALVQTHNYKSHLLARLVTVTTRTPWIGFHHGYTATDRKDVILSQADRISLPGALRIVTVCGAFSKQLSDRGIAQAKIEVVHNPVAQMSLPEPGERMRAREALGLNPEDFVLLAVGRLSREKGHSDLLRALTRLRESVPQLVTLIVGEGPEQSLLEEQVQAAGLAGRVRMLGHRSDVRACYVAADALVLPSHSEGSPNVLLEAFSAGLPVIATAVGGVPEIAIDGVNALLVPSRDPARLAEAISAIVSDPERSRQLASSARERVAERHTFEVYDRALMSIYASVAPHLSEGGRAAAT